MIRHGLRRFFLPERGILRPLPYAAIAAAGLLLGLAGSTLSLTQRIEWALYDGMTRFAARDPAPPADLVIVAIDEPSFAELGLPWPWPRRLHAALIDALARGGARTIVFDIVFDVPSNATDDEALSRAVRSAGNVVLAADRAVVTDRAYQVQQWVEPIPPLADAAAATGIVSIAPDPDGVLRRTAAAIDGRPTLALAAALKHPGFAAPADAGHPRLLHFCGGPRQGIITYSYYQALQPGLLPPGAVRGKTVLIGRSLSAAAAFDQPDHFRTPVAVRMPGVEVHANAIDTLLRGRAIADPFGALPALMLWGAAIGVLAAAMFFRMSPPAGLLALLALAAIGVTMAYVAVAGYGTRVPGVSPLIVVSAVYAATAAYRFALGQRERRLIRRAFQHYVAPAIVQQMLEDPSRLKLGGDAYEVTVLFTDLEGFTNVAERLTPSDLQTRLSTYFTAMMDVLLAERATLDKFIGDAIMVYFGCPIPDPAHPAQACRAALAMQRALDPLNADWARAGEPELRMRIGVNTGTAVAGNMGTNEIFNFTIIGDCVNLASRLEGVNKEYGSRIIVGEETWALVRGQFDARELDWIRVKGKARPVAVYELLAEAGGLPDARRVLVDAFAEGLALYRAQRWAEAAAAFGRACAIDAADGPSRVFVRRCEQYAAAPPLSEWDGVHVMHTK